MFILKGAVCRHPIETRLKPPKTGSNRDNLLKAGVNSDILSWQP